MKVILPSAKLRLGLPLPWLRHVRSVPHGVGHRWSSTFRLFRCPSPGKLKLELPQNGARSVKNAGGPARFFLCALLVVLAFTNHARATIGATTPFTSYEAESG